MHCSQGKSNFNYQTMHPNSELSRNETSQRAYSPADALQKVQKYPTGYSIISSSLLLPVHCQVLNLPPRTTGMANGMQRDMGMTLCEKASQSKSPCKKIMATRSSRRHDSGKQLPNIMMNAYIAQKNRAGKQTRLSFVWLCNSFEIRHSQCYMSQT